MELFIKTLRTLWVLKKWWTNVKGITDKSGFFKTRGFLGDYELSVLHNKKIDRL